MKRLTVLLFASFVALVEFSCTKEPEYISSPDNRLSGVDDHYYNWSFEYDEQGVLVSFYKHKPDYNDVDHITDKFPCVWEDGMLVKLGYYYNSYDSQGRLVSMIACDSMVINGSLVIYEERDILYYNDEGEIEKITYETYKNLFGDMGNVLEISYEWENGNISKIHHKKWRWEDDPDNVDSIYYDCFEEDLEYDSHPNPFLQLPVAVVVLLQRLMQIPEGAYTLPSKNNCVYRTEYTYKNNGYPRESRGWINRDYEYSGMIY
ncbi:MAG: hypothetical protein IJ789_07750 [Bacteroidales bacterium]|nr:hypothetical protein [Bacteroidales bacterium]